MIEEDTHAIMEIPTHASGRVRFDQVNNLAGGPSSRRIPCVNPTWWNVHLQPFQQPLNEFFPGSFANPHIHPCFKFVKSTDDAKSRVFHKIRGEKPRYRVDNPLMFLGVPIADPDFEEFGRVGRGHWFFQERFLRNPEGSAIQHPTSSDIFPCEKGPLIHTCLPQSRPLNGQEAPARTTHSAPWQVKGSLGKSPQGARWTAFIIFEIEGNHQHGFL